MNLNFLRQERDYQVSRSREFVEKPKGEIPPGHKIARPPLGGLKIRPEGGGSESSSPLLHLHEDVPALDSPWRKKTGAASDNQICSPCQIQNVV